MSGSLKEELLVQLGSIVEEAEKAVGGKPRPDPSGSDGSSEAPRGRKLKRTAQLSRQESYERLDVFEEEARAGAPDDWLARQAGVSLESVLWWRRERNLKRKRGPKRPEQVMTTWAAGFGLPYDSRMHAAKSELGGLWEAPEYVLRSEIRYVEFCRHLHALHIQLGSGPDILSRAFGIRPRDVELALAVWERHLNELNTPCTTCGGLIDPRYGSFCSVRCAEGRK